MTSNLGETCTVEGAQYLSVSATEVEICDLFQSKLSEALGSGGPGGDVAVSLEIEKSGTINASVTKTAESTPTNYPTVSVDVMDRPLNLSDVEQLAMSAARVIQTEDARAADSTE